MERLTIRNNEGIGVLKQPFKCERCGDLQWSLPDLGNGSPIDRLTDYEDTGLTPMQIREIDSLYMEKCKELAECQKNYLTGMELANIAVGLKKLREYENLERQRKLLKLPCAVGNTVYTNYAMQGWHLKKKDRPYEVKVVFIGINGVDNCMHVAFDNGCMIQCWFSDIGKTIFLTREEAEAALKEL